MWVSKTGEWPAESDMRCSWVGWRRECMPFRDGIYVPPVSVNIWSKVPGHITGYNSLPFLTSSLICTSNIYGLTTCSEPGSMHSTSTTEWTRQIKMSDNLWYRWTYLQGRNRDADVENRYVDTGARRRCDELGGWVWHNTLSCIKQTARENLLYSTGHSTWCSAMN